jgi:hypothetical protein
VCVAGNGNEGFLRARQVFYYWATSPAPSKQHFYYLVSRIAHKSQDNVYATDTKIRECQTLGFKDLLCPVFTVPKAADLSLQNTKYFTVVIQDNILLEQ